MSRKNDDWELEELDLEDEQQDGDWEDGYDGWTEESKPMKPTAMILVFLGLVVLAAIICGILWNFTHRDSDNNNSGESSVEQSMESIPESAMGEGTQAVPESASESEEEPSVEGTDPISESDGQGAAAPSVEGTGPVSESDGQEASEPSYEAEVPSSEPLSEATPEPTPEAASESTPAPVASSETVDDRNRVSTKDGRVIVFTDCDDIVSPKEYVNLRLEPSTSEGNSTVHCQLQYGETVHRTGISEDSGWSRVEKDGVTCYVVTSYIYVVEE